jgi:hypothetical protein
VTICHNPIVTTGVVPAIAMRESKTRANSVTRLSPADRVKKLRQMPLFD